MHKRGCLGTLHFLETLNPSDPRSYSIQNSCFSCVHYTHRQRMNGDLSTGRSPSERNTKTGAVSKRGLDPNHLLGKLFFKIIREKKRSIVHNRHFALKLFKNNKTEQSF